MLPFLDKKQKKEQVVHEYLYIEEYIPEDKKDKKKDVEEEEKSVIIDIF